MTIDLKKRILAPSILSADFNHLQEDIGRTVSAGSEMIHFDVMDGDFVPNISFGVPVLKSIRKNISVPVDVHLMIQHPQTIIPSFVKAGADMISVHYEAVRDPMDLCGQIHDEGVLAGIVINPDTPVQALYPILQAEKTFDYVLLMSVFPGFGGQSFIEESLDRAREFRAWLDDNRPGVGLEMDGGIGAANVSGVLDAGVNLIVAGSAVFKGDIEANTKAIIEKF